MLTVCAGKTWLLPPLVCLQPETAARQKPAPRLAKLAAFFSCRQHACSAVDNKPTSTQVNKTAAFPPIAGAPPSACMTHATPAFLRLCLCVCLFFTPCCPSQISPYAEQIMTLLDCVSSRTHGCFVLPWFPKAKCNSRPHERTMQWVHSLHSALHSASRGQYLFTNTHSCHLSISSSQGR